MIYMNTQIVNITVLGLLLSATVAAEEFTLTSPAINSGNKIANEQVFHGFGCQGSNISPELSWQHAPQETKSFALTVYDPDAPTGSGWWHWVLFNIPADVTSLKKGAGDPKSENLPFGAVQSRTDFGQIGYGGPCPPVGDKPHRYQFTIFALKTDLLPLDENTPAAMVGFYLRKNSLGTAMIQGYYGR